MKKQYILLLAALLFTTVATPIFADDEDTDFTELEDVTESESQHKKYSFPGKSEIFIVGRITVKADEDMDFFSKTRGVQESNLTKSNSFVIPKYYDSDEETKDWSKSQRMLYNDGDFFFVKYDIPKDRMIRFGSIAYYFFNDRKMTIALPMDFSFEVPKDVNYVYIGSHTYTITGDDFTITHLSSTDEYDQAQEAVNKIAGKKQIRLSRVALQTYDAKKSK